MRSRPAADARAVTAANDGPDPRRPGGHDVDRSLDELLQELRVTQTGIQVFVAFLLTVPFAPAFEDLDAAQRNLYAAALGSAVTATALLVAPVAIHRAIFGRRLRPALVSFANVLMVAGLLMLLAAMALGVTLVSTVVFAPGTPGRYWLPATATLVLVLAWVVLPVTVRYTRPRGNPAANDHGAEAGERRG